MEEQRGAHFDEIKRAQKIIDEQVVLNRGNESKVASLMKELAEKEASASHTSQHWMNPETGQAECECCCGWALDFDAMRERAEKAEAELAALREGAKVRYFAKGQ